jgi:hypothetical protein
MSDLLTRMIARSGRMTEGIMPVAPSRYEGAVALDSPAVPEAVVEQVAGEVAGEIPVHQGQEVRREEVQSGEVRQADLTRPRPKPIPPKEAKAISPPQILEMQQQDGGGREPAPGHRAHFDEPVQTRPDPEIQRPRTAEYKIHEAAADAMEAEFIPEEWPRFETEARIIEEPFSRAVTDPSEPLHSAPVRRREPGSRSPAPERSVEVHVSIGHIELRQAAPAPQPVQRRAPAVPPVPLEDLLGRRRGGVR